MHENRALRKEDPDFRQSDLSSLSSHPGDYPQSVFSTLVWLRREHETLTMLELAEPSTSRTQALCTIVAHLRKRGDGEKQQILTILAQVQEYLVCLPLQDRDITVDRLQAALVAELAAWQQWLPAQELAHTISGSWKREEALGSIFREMLQADMWEEALTVARSAGDAGHWMLCNLCAALAKMRAWDKAEEVARSIERTASKVAALSLLAGELASASEVARAQMLWKQAIQAAYAGEISASVLTSLSKDLARAQQWELAETVARAITFPLPGAENRPKWQGSQRHQQMHNEIHACWTPVERSKALARLASEYSKAQRWERVEALWEEARVVANACKSIWHYTVALGNLTLCFAEANLWELALDTWRQTEAVWRKTQPLPYSLRETFTEQDEDDDFHPDEDEEEQRRLKVLIPLCHYLVRAQRWKQAWKLFCELEDAPIKIRVGREIAAALDQIEQNEDALLVWKHTSALALVTKLETRDQTRLALALQQAGHGHVADTIWQASVNSMLEADEDDFYGRSINCGWLALKLAQAQRREDGELLLKECMNAATLSASADLQQVD